MLIAPIKLKKCSQCGGEWDEEAAFRKNPPRWQGSLPASRPRCVGCELTERNDPSPEARARKKAKETLDYHAGKYGMKPDQFARRYGWDTNRMAYDIMHIYENTCCYCWERYDGMGNGLRDITLDIVDREREPYYGTNVRWCCSTCNSEKATMSPELWARRLNFWREYHNHIESIKKNVVHGLPMEAYFGPAKLISMVVLALLF